MLRIFGAFIRMFFGYHEDVILLSKGYVIRGFGKYPRPHIICTTVGGFADEFQIEGPFEEEYQVLKITIMIMSTDDVGFMKTKRGYTSKKNKAINQWPCNLCINRASAHRNESHG